MVCFVGRWFKVCENQIYPKLSIAVFLCENVQQAVYISLQVKRTLSQTTRLVLIKKLETHNAIKRSLADRL